MSKAVLILEMPVHCDQCPLWEDHDDWDEMVGRCIIVNGARSRTYGRPAWCPLREMPERDNVRYGDETDGVAFGWNACLDKLEGKHE